MSESAPSSSTTTMAANHKKRAMAPYVTAACYFLAVAGSLYIQHHLTEAYHGSAAASLAWAERSRSYDRIGRNLALIHSLSSDAVTSSDAEGLWKQSREAYQAIEEQLTVEKTNVKTQLPADTARELVSSMNILSVRSEEFSEASETLFSFSRQHLKTRVREQLPAVSKAYHKALKTFWNLRTIAVLEHRRHLDMQVFAAHWLEKLQLVIASLLVLIVALLFFYGYKLSKKVTTSTLEKELLIEQVHEAEDKYRLIVDNAVEGIFQTSPQGRYLTANMSLARMYGYDTPRELIASITDINKQLFVNQNTRKEVLDYLKKADVVTGVEAEIYRKDGNTIWASFNIRAVRDKKGGIAYLEGTVEDITEKRWAELRRSLHYATTKALAEAVTEAEARPKILQTICEILDWDMGTVWNVDSRNAVLKCSEVWHRENIDIDEFEEATAGLTFVKGEGLAGKVWKSGEPAWLSDIKKNGVSVNMKIAAKNGMNSAYCFPIKTATEVIQVLKFFSPKISQPDAELLQTLAAIGSQLGQMIERKRADEALRESEARKGAILESALDCIITFDHEGHITEFNPAAERAFGYQRANALGKEMVELIIPESLRETHRRGLALYHATSGGPTLGRRIELTAMRSSGAEFPVEMAISRISVNGKPMFTAYIRDITEKKRAERVTSELAAVVEFSNDAIIGKTLDGMIVSWNAGAERIYGYSADEVIGRHVFILAAPDRADELTETLAAVKRGDSLVNFETIQLRKDGKRIWVSLTESPIRNEKGKITGISSIARDITERKRLEEQFLQSQKMEAVGRLAGGVAHDFNNILTAILGYSDILLSQMNSTNAMYSSLCEIRRAGEFAATLTHQLLAFSRRQSLQLKVLDINDAVNGIEKMIVRLIGEDIQVITVLDESIEKIKADPGQLEQVILNLAVNARDAMPKGGVITIQTSNVTLLDEDVADNSELSAGEYVKLSISDTGCGMTPDVKKHLFEPFFTTKDQGKGTGLGLATCYGIVKQCNGHILVDSTVGQGTTFQIFFPRIKDPVELAATGTKIGELPRGSETVLIVEDQEGVRVLAAHILRRLGYKVLEAVDADDARAVVQLHNSEPIDLLLADVVLPNSGSGKEIADWLEAQNGNTKVLFTSGYVEETVFSQHGLDPGMAFLQKPFTPADLANRVREVIEG